MNQYVTGAVIKKLRQKNNMTQAQLADRLGVSDKTVSKWETGKGYPEEKAVLNLCERPCRNSIKLDRRRCLEIWILVKKKCFPEKV